MLSLFVQRENESASCFLNVVIVPAYAGVASKEQATLASNDFNSRSFIATSFSKRLKIIAMLTSSVE